MTLPHHQGRRDITCVRKCRKVIPLSSEKCCWFCSRPFDFTAIANFFWWITAYEFKDFQESFKHPLACKNACIFLLSRMRNSSVSHVWHAPRKSFFCSSLVFWAEWYDPEWIVCKAWGNVLLCKWTSQFFVDVWATYLLNPNGAWWSVDGTEAIHQEISLEELHSPSYKHIRPICPIGYAFWITFFSFA